MTWVAQQAEGRNGSQLSFITPDISNSYKTIRQCQSLLTCSFLFWNMAFQINYYLFYYMQGVGYGYFKVNLLLFFNYLCFYFQRASLVTQMVKNRLQCRRPGFDPWVRKTPWRREWLPTPVLTAFVFISKAVNIHRYDPWEGELQASSPGHLEGHFELTLIQFPASMPSSTASIRKV